MLRRLTLPLILLIIGVALNNVISLKSTQNGQNGVPVSIQILRNLFQILQVLFGKDNLESAVEELVEHFGHYRYSHGFCLSLSMQSDNKFRE